MDMSIRIWDASTGKQLRKLLGHTKGVLAIAFSHDTQYIVSGSEDMSVCIWARELKVGDQLKQLNGHIDGVRSVAFSHDDTQVVSGSYDILQIVSGSSDHSVRIWDASTGKELKQFHTTATVISVVFSPDGQNIVSSIGLLNSDLGCHEGGATEEVHQFCTRIVSASTDSIRVWNTMASESSKSSRATWAQSTLSSNGTLACSIAAHGRLLIWDTASGKLVTEQYIRQESNSEISGATQSPSRLSLSSLTVLNLSLVLDDSSIRTWDMRNGENRQVLTGHTRSVTSVAVSGGGEQIVSGSKDKSVVVWDAKTGESGLGDDVAVWDMTTREKKLLHPRGHSNVRSVAFSPDGTLIVSGSEDGKGGFGRPRIMSRTRSGMVHMYIIHIGLCGFLLSATVRSLHQELS
ncbi:YVTN repeat-like/Quino protein amine dehydrogenase [Hymenopellis radicata]|nr:YVTN repeat-like/Quino protein amine dehydrogenase [Hymenopellis radicata]